MSETQAGEQCRYEDDIWYCVTHSSPWHRDEACDQVYIDAERDEADRVMQQAKDERWEFDDA